MHKIDHKYKTRNLLLVFMLSILFGFTVIKSDSLKVREGDQFKIQINDSTEIDVCQVIDQQTNLPVYYYSYLNVPVCNTGECKLVEMTMFWDIYGNYYKYTVPTKSPLTKAKHKPFKKREYAQLHFIINDTTSKLKNLKFNTLTEKQADKWYKTDANTSATIKFIDHTKIKGAVKTSHTLWHIANDTAKTMITAVTNQYFSNQKGFSDSFQERTKTKEGILEQLIHFQKLNLTETQYLIEYIEKHNLTDRSVRKLMKKGLKAEDTEKAILFANYALRNKYTKCKSKQLIRSTNFKKDEVDN